MDKGKESVNEKAACNRRCGSRGHAVGTDVPRSGSSFAVNGDEYCRIGYGRAEDRNHGSDRHVITYVDRAFASEKWWEI